MKHLTQEKQEWFCGALTKRRHELRLTRHTATSRWPAYYSALRGRPVKINAARRTCQRAGIDWPVEFEIEAEQLASLLKTYVENRPSGIATCLPVIGDIALNIFKRFLDQGWRCALAVSSIEVLYHARIDLDWTAARAKISVLFAIGLTEPWISIAFEDGSPGCDPPIDSFVVSEKNLTKMFRWLGKHRPKPEKTPDPPAKKKGKLYGLHDRD